MADLEAFGLRTVSTPYGGDGRIAVMVRCLEQAISVMKITGETGALAFAVTPHMLEDYYGLEEATSASADSALAFVQGQIVDPRFACGWLAAAQAVLVVLHTNGREASEAELAKVLNKETPNG
jgi:hypothetical protein